MIFYFTGTGNSLYAAKQLDSELYSIPQMLRRKKLSHTAEKIGIVCPVYGHEMPGMVKEFLTKADFCTDYFYIVLTYGNRHGGAAKLAEQFCQRIGKKTDYINTVLMADNFLPAFDMEEQAAANKGTDEQLARIKADIESRKAAVQKASLAERTIHRSYLARVNNAPETLWADYIITEKCIGCGICTRICPAGCVHLENQHAVNTKEGCQACFACIHACPEMAIRFGDIPLKEPNPNARYRNPGVTLTELVQSNDQTMNEKQRAYNARKRRTCKMTNFTLSNGITMPAVGIGTFMMSPAQAQKAVYDALTCGYRMIDTAQAYMNERAVGRGIRESGVPRKDIFLSTKIWASQYLTEGTVEKSLELLDTDYIDLMFIHQPAGDFMAGYRKLEAAYKEGKIKSIGISNFHGAKLERLLSECEIKPHVIQMEAHPYFMDTDTIDKLKNCGCRVMAWYPLGHGDKSLINEPVFTALAEKYGKSNAQIILRWHVQMGNQIIPGSTNPEHIKANADIFDFELTSEEMAEIAKINKNVRYYNSTEEQVENYVNMVIDLDSQE